MVGAWNGGFGSLGIGDLEGDPGTGTRLRHCLDRPGCGGAQRRPEPLSKALRRGSLTRVREKVHSQKSVSSIYACIAR